MQKVFSFFRRFWLPLAGILIIVLIAIAFFAGRHTVYQAHPELSGVEQANAVLAKVGKLIELPQNETPQMATIEDADTVRESQPFLINAQDGDVLILFASAQTAILYRPSTNKLIAVGPVANEESPSTPPEPEPEVIEDENATTTDEN